MTSLSPDLLRFAVLLALVSGCTTSGTDSSTTNAAGTSTESGTSSLGDGDGDPAAGDGDGDPGDGDGDPGDGDGDGDPGDGDGEPGDGDGDPGDGDGDDPCAGDGDGDMTGDGDGDVDFGEGCESIVAAQLVCDEESNSVDYCLNQIDDHPAIDDQAACTQAMVDRFSCYSKLDCCGLSKCDLWGCTEDPEPCPDEAAMVEATCVRTPCEQYFDQARACGSETIFPSMPGYCNYLKYLDALAVSDPDACIAAYDEVVACYATIECADFDLCNFSSGCEQGVQHCYDERVALNQSCQ